MKELALYVRDNITKGNWSFNLGLRGDFYNGLDDPQGRRASPRSRLQHQEDEYRSSRFLCAAAGNSLQRKSGALQHRVRQSGAESASGLYRARCNAVQSGLAQ